MVLKINFLERVWQRLVLALMGLLLLRHIRIFITTIAITDLHLLRFIKITTMIITMIIIIFQILVGKVSVSFHCVTDPKRRRGLGLRWKVRGMR